MLQFFFSNIENLGSFFPQLLFRYHCDVLGYLALKMIERPCYFAGVNCLYSPTMMTSNLYFSHHNAIQMALGRNFFFFFFEPKLRFPSTCV